MDAALRRYRDLLLWLLPAALAAVARWRVMVAVRLRAAAAHRCSPAAAREIDVRTLERRLPTRGVHDELEDVARAFNDTLARLEHSVGEMRQFSAALAHELRTPLAALRGEIELALRTLGHRDDAERSTLASQIEELDRLARLIDQILTLARAESGQIRLTFAPVDVGALAASLVEQLEPVAQARTIELRCERNGAVVVNGDAGWLQRLLLNLLDNAIKFTREGGHVVLRVSRDAGSRADRRARHRHRHVARRHAARLRALLPGRSGAVVGDRRRRRRPQPGQVDRRSPRRHDRRATAGSARARPSRSCSPESAGCHRFFIAPSRLCQVVRSVLIDQEVLCGRS